MWGRVGGLHDKSSGGLAAGAAPADFSGSCCILSVSSDLVNV
jgi:hypothetical protein